MSATDTTLIDADVKLWRRVPRDELTRFWGDVRFSEVREKMSPEVTEAIEAALQERKEERVAVKRKKLSPQSILDELESIIADAEAAGDFTAQLRAVEMKGRHIAMFATKPEEKDRSIVINVITGVPRRGDK
jgi:chromatin segregation and condensation protein Rec8/ScpA/Scc1 (kleisin family)